MLLTKKFKEFVEDIDPIIQDTYMVGYRTTDEEEVRIPLDVVSSGGLRKYLRKDIEDFAEEKIEFRKGLRSGGDTGSIQYIQGLLGWYGDKQGNFEMNSLILRDFLEVPELRKNKITVMGNEFWFTDSCTVKEVKDLGNQKYEVLFKLEENEFAPFRSSDLLRGIFHYTTGFYTVILHVYEVIFDMTSAGAIGVRVESLNGKAPEKAMLLARMNNSADPDRQGSMYVDGLNGWLRVLKGYKPSNPTLLGDYDTLKLQIGNLNGLKGHPVFGDMEGYGIYASNAYFTGRFMQKSWDGTEEQPMFFWRGVYNDKATYYPFDLIRYTKADRTEVTYYLNLNDTTKNGITGITPEDSKPADVPDKDFPLWSIYNTSGGAGSSVHLTFNSSEAEPNKPTGNGTTLGWYHNPNADTVWMSEKVAPTIDDGEWSDPIKIKGNVGADGEGNQFIFKVSTTTAVPSAPNNDYTTNGTTQSNAGLNFQNDSYVPDKLGWEDNPIEVNSTDKYLFVSRRFKRYDAANKVSKWSQYSIPTIFAVYAEDGAPGQDGAPGIPGTDGAPAKSVEIVGESMFIKPKGFTGYEPTSIQLTAIAKNVTDAGVWQYKSGNDWLPLVGKQQTTVLPTDPCFIGNVATIRYFINNNIYDIHSITKVQDGNDGAPGADGTSVRILGTKPTINELPMTGNQVGDGWLVQGNLYVWTGTEWIDAGKIQGPQGDQGIPGTPGADGKTPYLHIKYSNDGKTFTPAVGDKDPGETPGSWLGQYTDYNAVDSNVFNDYIWSKIGGEDAYTVLLSNEIATIHCDEDGTPYVGEVGNTTASSKAKTTVSMYQGSKKLTPTIAIAASTGITAKVSNDVVFITAVSIGFESGYIDITCTASGLSLTKRFTVKIVKDGTTGPAVAYYGEWNDMTQYYCRDNMRTVVKVTNTSNNTVDYWMSKLTSELDPGVDPNIPLITPPKQTTTHWKPFAGQFESIATGILLAENATIDILDSNAIFVGANKTSNSTTATGWKLNESSIKSLRTGTNGQPLTQFTTDGQMLVQRGKIGNWSITNNGLIYIDTDNNEQAGFKPNTTTGVNSNLLLYTNFDEGRYGAPYAFYVTNDGLLSTERLETNSLKVDNSLDVGNWSITKDTILANSAGNIVMGNGLVTTGGIKDFGVITVSNNDTNIDLTKTYTYDAFYGKSLREYVVDVPAIDCDVSIPSGKTIYIYAHYKHYKTTDITSDYWYDRSDFGSFVRAYFTDGTSEDIAINKFVFTIPYRHRNEGLLSNFSYTMPSGKNLMKLRVVIKNKMKSHAQTTWNTTALVNLKVFGSSANSEWQIGNNGFYFKKGTDSYFYSDIKGSHIIRAKGKMIFESNSGAASIIMEDDTVRITGNTGGGGLPGSIATTDWVTNYMTWTNLSGKPAWIGTSKPTYTAAEVGLGNVRNIAQLGQNEKAVDSDKLDGIDSTGFFKTTANHANNLDNYQNNSCYWYTPSVSNRPNEYGIVLNVNSDQAWRNQLAFGTNSNMYFRQKINDEFWREWVTLWHSSNSDISTKDWNAKNFIGYGSKHTFNGIDGKDYSMNFHLDSTDAMIAVSNKAQNYHKNLIIQTAGDLGVGGVALPGYKLSVHGNQTITGNLGVQTLSTDITLAIGDSDTGFRWISDGYLRAVANGVSVFDWSSGNINTYLPTTINNNLFISESLSSTVFASGFTGNGFKIEKDAASKYNATFDTLTVRGSMNVYELVVNKIRSTNGALAVTDSLEMKFDSFDYDGKWALAKGYVVGDDLPNYTSPFKAGDIVKCQRWTGKTIISYITQVSNVDGTQQIFLLKNYNGVTIPNPKQGDVLVRWDSVSDSNRKGLLYLTSSDSNAPYMDVLYGQATKVRLGRLDGVVDANLGILSGYGLYADNVYLKGKVVANSGIIGGWNIDSDKLSNNTMSISSTTGIKFGNNFSVDAAGNVTALNANISGSITATSGKIGVFTLTSYGELSSTSDRDAIISITPANASTRIYGGAIHLDTKSYDRALYITAAQNGAYIDCGTGNNAMALAGRGGLNMGVGSNQFCSMPGVLLAGKLRYNNRTIYNRFGHGVVNPVISSTGTGSWQLFHGLGHTNYVAVANPEWKTGEDIGHTQAFVRIEQMTENTVNFRMVDSFNGNPVNANITFALIGYNG